MFNKQFLADVRRRALRRGVWFSALDSVERGILTLTSRLVDEVRSTELCVELVKILAKIRDALRSGFVRRMEEYGLVQARRLSAQAVEWGYTSAKGWASSFDFVRFLTLIDVNRPTGFGVY
ncbi:MAG: hypothetical protein ACFFDN_00705 [Candidatus Hodarchaeota archaeon]